MNVEIEKIARESERAIRKEKMHELLVEDHKKKVEETE